MKLRLPATSANLGPAFDAAALALGLWLEVEAEVAENWSIVASGRNARQCEDVENSLIVRKYCDVCVAAGVEPPPLAMRMRNEIPFGMGLGSSAAALLAGVYMANQALDMKMKWEEVVAQAAAFEGHADNVAACWHGGLTFVATNGSALLECATLPPPAGWSAAIVLPEKPVPTTRARGVVPTSLHLASAVHNVQRTALLAAAFAQSDTWLMREATRDMLHQPYRSELCPLYSRMEPMRDEESVISVTLSGAGPSVLLLLNEGKKPADRAALSGTIAELAGEPVEVIFASLDHDGAQVR